MSKKARYRIVMKYSDDSVAAEYEVDLDYGPDGDIPTAGRAIELYITELLDAEGWRTADFCTEESGVALNMKYVRRVWYSKVEELKDENIIS